MNHASSFNCTFFCSPLVRSSSRRTCPSSIPGNREKTLMLPDSEREVPVCKLSSVIKLVKKWSTDICGISYKWYVWTHLESLKVTPLPPTVPNLISEVTKIWAGGSLIPSGLITLQNNLLYVARASRVRPRSTNTEMATNGLTHKSHLTLSVDIVSLLHSLARVVGIVEKPECSFLQPG